jgi:hypothetical protein
MPNSGQTSTGWEGQIPKTKQIYANGWQGYKTPALKPAWEAILCFRAPRNGMTYAELALKYGTGCLNIDGGRIGNGANKWDSPKGGFWQESISGDQRLIDNPLGRYPANLVLDEEAAAMLDEQSGMSRSRKLNPANPGKITPVAMNWGSDDRSTVSHKDAGGASRFFYVAKASSKERNAGCEDLEDRIKPGGMRTANGDAEKGHSSFDKGFQDTIVKNDHLTVKPIALCKYLATLLLPPASVAPRRLFVPFCGSGSELIGALLAGWDEFIGVE